LAVDWRDSDLKAASDCMRGHTQESGKIFNGTVGASKLDGLLIPFENFTNLPVGQLSPVSARGFHGRLLIDESQAHCLRDRKGTAPASGHGSIDGPKGRERVRARP